MQTKENYKSNIHYINECKTTNIKYNSEIEKEKNNLDNKMDNNNNKEDISENEIIVFSNKNKTYSKGFGEITNKNNNDELKKKYEIIRKNKDLNLNEKEITNYYDIIQDMSDMILIYENIIFKKNVKPKNNNELSCYLIVEYINKKIIKIKLNTLINLFIYKESRPKKYNNISRIYTYGKISENETTTTTTDYRGNRKSRKPYISGRSKKKDGES